MVQVHASDDLLVVVATDNHNEEQKLLASRDVEGREIYDFLLDCGFLGIGARMKTNQILDIREDKEEFSEEI